MKKLLSFIMALALVFSFCGCNNEKNEKAEKENKEETKLNQEIKNEVDVPYKSNFANIMIYEDRYGESGVGYITSTGDVYYNGEKIGSNAVMMAEDGVHGEHYILYADGTVGDIHGNKKEGLNDIVAIEMGDVNNETGLIALRKDGTIYLEPFDDDSEISQFYHAEEWTDIVAISDAMPFHILGLKSDGTVVAAGSNSDGQCDIENWKDIAAVYTSYLDSDYESASYGIKKDGTVVCTCGEYADSIDISDWTDIVSLSFGGNFVMGLKSDGTVVTRGKDYYGETKISDWKDIVAIKAYGGLSIGIKADGTVVSAGDNYIITKYLKDVKIKVK